MDKRQEKAKELYRNKKNGFICLRNFAVKQTDKSVFYILSTQQ